MCPCASHLPKMSSFATNEPVSDYYRTLGLIGEGAYGVVRKAERIRAPPSAPGADVAGATQAAASGRHKYQRASQDQWRGDQRASQHVAVKQMKSSRAGVGIPQDAYREIKILKELHHPNTVRLEGVHMNSGDDGLGSLYLVYDYAEHDLAEIIRYHRQSRVVLNPRILKSVLWQILNGIDFLHKNWVMHRDVKPANILIMGRGPDHGRVKIADFGLARIFQGLLRRLSDDGDVVTIWYRAPELLLGSKHYTPAIDIWAVGCIFAEMITSQPLFMGEEAKVKEKGERHYFQADQLQKIFKVLGTPSPATWPLVVHCPFWPRVTNWNSAEYVYRLNKLIPPDRISKNGFDLLRRMLTYDPAKRITAAEALEHPYFSEQPFASKVNALQSDGEAAFPYPRRHLKAEKSASTAAPTAATEATAVAASGTAASSSSAAGSKRKRASSSAANAQPAAAAAAAGPPPKKR